MTWIIRFFSLISTNCARMNWIRGAVQLETSTTINAQECFLYVATFCRVGKFKFGFCASMLWYLFVSTTFTKHVIAFFSLSVFFFVPLLALGDVSYHTIVCMLSTMDCFRYNQQQHWINYVYENTRTQWQRCSSWRIAWTVKLKRLEWFGIGMGLHYRPFWFEFRLWDWWKIVWEKLPFLNFSLFKRAKLFPDCDRLQLKIFQ